MTRRDVMRLAMQAGLLDKVDCSDDYFVPADAFISEMEQFANLVEITERDACANLRKDIPLIGAHSAEYEEGFWDGLAAYEAAILARGEK